MATTISNPLTFAQKVRLQGYNPVVLLRGKRWNGVPFFAYVEMTKEEYERLTPENYKGAKHHGKIILEGDGLPSEEQRQFMEKHYEFDHSGIDWDA